MSTDPFFFFFFFQLLYLFRKAALVIINWESFRMEVQLLAAAEAFSCQCVSYLEDLYLLFAENRLLMKSLHIIGFL